MTRSYTLIAPAKINLYLGIVGSRADGFHELVMVLQSIGLADTVTVQEIRGQDIQITCDQPDVPVDETNLAWKAADLMRRNFPEAAAKHGGVAIAIQKRIPMGAGLAGGSADCAAVLVGIDLLWNLGLTQSELQDLAAMLGSDIPFCVSGGTAIATGRGEVLDPLPDLDNIYVVLAKYRDLPVSTPWAYKTFRANFGHTYPESPEALDGRKRAMQSGEMMQAIAHKDAKAIGRLLYNDLEKVVLPEYPQVQALRDRFAEIGCLGTMMSGSGSTVFALAESQEAAETICSKMRSMVPDEDLELWVTQFNQSGVRLAAT
ncbi:MAG: 4-(cytidine 5'-diphospho)-2-C-methyl-D-erythritol kinase [Alkalinema sp. CACIAM 70d]|nr:MAG: 4-(cytidine 5'-diphospho)-2-C-methyl-D-erythritol kinase [Alkalinema sp. CACIAM 70d]